LTVAADGSGQDELEPLQPLHIKGKIGQLLGIALHWLIKSSKQSHGLAQHKTALLYMLGVEPVDPDTDKHGKWYNRPSVVTVRMSLFWPHTHPHTFSLSLTHTHTCTHTVGEQPRACIAPQRSPAFFHVPVSGYLERANETERCGGQSKSGAGSQVARNGSKPGCARVRVCDRSGQRNRQWYRRKSPGFLCVV